MYRASVVPTAVANRSKQPSTGEVVGDQARIGSAWVGRWRPDITPAPSLPPTMLPAPDILCELAIAPHAWAIT